MKGILAVVAVLGLFFFVGYASANAYCVVAPTCVANGGNCSADTFQCVAGSFCNYSVPAGPTCQPLVPLGGYCSGSNDACEGDDEAMALCWNNVCTARTNTAVLGQNCTDLTQCNFKYMCNDSGICVEYPQKGQNCTRDCDIGLTCNFGVCIAEYSIALGGACDTSMLGLGATDICAPGLYCSFNTSTCKTGFPSSNVPCDLNNATSCANPEEYCGCNTNSQSVCTAPQTLTQPQVTSFNELFQCAYDNNCYAGNPSCCFSQQCALYNTIETPFNMELYYVCGNTNPMASCSNGSNMKRKLIIGGIIAGVVVAVAIVVVLIMKNRKKHHYDKI